jgi:hypothetical protein
VHCVASKLRRAAAGIGGSKPTDITRGPPTLGRCRLLQQNLPISDSCTAAKAPIASIAMRGMKHAQRDRAQQARRSRRRSPHRESLHGHKVREGRAALAEKRSRRWHGSPSGNTAAFAVRREMELMRPWNSLRCYLYAFCTCLPQRSNELATMDLLRVSASEFDLGTSGETGFEQMLRPPFRVARNRGSGGCLAAGHLQ